MEDRVLMTTAAGVRIASGTPVNGAEKLAPAALLDFYRRNKYPLVALKTGSPYGNGFFSSPEFTMAYQHHAATLGELRAEFNRVQQRWEQAGIPCITIKSGGSWLPFPYTSDNLDILIHKEHEAKARAILEDLGYIELVNLEEPRKFLFRRFTGGRRVADIHLHTRIGWGVSFMDDDSVWAKAKPAPGDETLTIPSPEDTILINLAHSFYENKQLRLSDMAKVQESFREKIDWEYLKTTAAKAGWLDGLCFSLLVTAHVEKTLLGHTSVPAAILEECRSLLRRWPLINRYYLRLVRRSPVSLPFTVSFIFSKYLFYRKILNDGRYPLKARLYEVFRTFVRGLRLKARIRPQPSMLVTFSGLDGSGKTQHARTLAACLEMCDLQTYYVWSRCATSRFTRFFSACRRILWPRSEAAAGGGASVPERRQKLRHPVLRFFWFNLVAMDMIISIFFRVSLPLWHGKIVICDRYVYDAAAEMASSFPRIDPFNRLAIRLMLLCAPRPDVAYFLDVPENISAQRKEGGVSDYLKRQREHYLVLAQRYHLRIKSTEADFATNADEIIREVAVPYYGRFPTWLNWIFLSNHDQLNNH